MKPMFWESRTVFTHPHTVTAAPFSGVCPYRARISVRFIVFPPKIKNSCRLFFGHAASPLAAAMKIKFFIAKQ